MVLLRALARPLGGANAGPRRSGRDRSEAGLDRRLRAPGHADPPDTTKRTARRRGARRPRRRAPRTPRPDAVVGAARGRAGGPASQPRRARRRALAAGEVPRPPARRRRRRGSGRPPAPEAPAGVGRQLLLRGPPDGPAASEATQRRLRTATAAARCRGAETAAETDDARSPGSLRRTAGALPEAAALAPAAQPERRELDPAGRPRTDERGFAVHRRAIAGLLGSGGRPMR